MDRSLPRSLVRHGGEAIIHVNGCAEPELRRNRKKRIILRACYCEKWRLPLNDGQAFAHHLFNSIEIVSTIVTGVFDRYRLPRATLGVVRARKPHEPRGLRDSGVTTDKICKLLER